MKTLNFDTNDVIFKQGDFSSTMYNIVSGCVGIFKDYDTEDAKELAELGPDNFLGEMGFLEVYPRSATAVALEPTVLEELGDDDLNDYFRTKPDKLLVIMKQISHRLRETDQKYVDACRTVYETAAAEQSGEAKSEQLQNQIDTICTEYIKM